MTPISIRPIKGYKTFSIILEAGVKVKKYPLLGSFVYDLSDIGLSPRRFEELSEDGKFFFGVSISKRRARKAVVRNRVKRLLRESIRLVLKEFEEQGRPTPEYKAFVLLWLKGPQRPGDISLHDVLPTVRKAMIRATVKNTTENLIRKS